MNKKYLKIIIIGCLLMVVCLTLMYFSHSIFGDRRFIDDPSDKGYYLNSGEWLPKHYAPFTSKMESYPQLPTYYFGFLYLISGYDNPKLYFFIFSISMAIFFICSLILITQIHKYYDFNINNVYLLFLPSFLYFSINRFDIVPVFLTLLSLLFFFKKKYALAVLFLSIGFFVKWYTILLIPILGKYIFDTEKKIYWKGIFVFLGVIGFFVLLNALWSGLDALLNPFIQNTTRGSNAQNIFGILKTYVFNNQIPINTITTLILLVLQLFPFYFIFSTKINTPNRMLIFSALAILSFTFFAKFYSPQWMIWLTPIIILLIKDKVLLILYILLDVFSYIYFPVGEEFNVLYIGVPIVLVLRVVIGIYFIKQYRKEIL